MSEYTANQQLAATAAVQHAEKGELLNLRKPIRFSDTAITYADPNDSSTWGIVK